MDSQEHIVNVQYNTFKGGKKIYYIIFESFLLSLSS